MSHCVGLYKYYNVWDEDANFNTKIRKRQIHEKMRREHKGCMGCIKFEHGCSDSFEGNPGPSDRTQ